MWRDKADHGPDKATEGEPENEETERGRTSGQLIAKSISIKGHGGRSGRCAAKAVRLTLGGLRSVPQVGTGEPRGDLTGAQKSAEGIVGHAVGKAHEALQKPKGE